jgi:hypothetical protein
MALSHISPLGWLLIAILVIFTLVVNIAMIAMLRTKTSPGSKKSGAETKGLIGTSRNLTKINEVMLDPFAKERNQVEELSRLVQDLENSQPVKVPERCAERQDSSRKAK